MKSFIKSDYFLIIVSVLASVLIWIFVVYEQNPIHETWINDVPIVYTNRSSDFESGKLIVLDGMEPSIDVKIRGRRSILSTVNISDITCSVNMSEIKSEGEYSLPVAFSSSVYGIELTQKRPYNVELTVDKTVTDERSVSVVTVGEVKSGYVAGDIVCEPTTVKLTGPQSIIWNIETASVSVDLTGADKDIVNLYKIKLYNENGVEIIDDRVSKNIEYCDVTCPVYAKKTIEITPLLMGETNLNGEKITVTEVVPKNITVIGTSEQVASVTEIYTKNIYVADITGVQSITAKIDLSMLPEGVKVDGDVTDVSITLQVEGNTSQQPQDDQLDENQDTNNGNTTSQTEIGGEN